MSSLNRVDLIGNLGADPEIRRLASGDPVCNLRIATTETWKDRDGNKQERTTWHSVVIFNEGIAKVAENYLRKGSKVFVSGSLQNREWNDQQGAKRTTTEIVLQKFRGELQMLDKVGSNDDAERERFEKANQSRNLSEAIDDTVPF